MNYLEKSLDRCRALVSTAQDRALQLKGAGLLESVASPQAGFLGDWKEQAKGRVQYAQFRGWLYAAINVLAAEAAGQPVCVGRMGGVEDKKSIHRPRGSKTFHMRKMTTSAYAKAATTELEVLNDHPLLSSLERPNPFQGRWQFVYSFVANLNLTGWAYIVAGEGEDGKQEFYSLPTTWVRPDHSEGPFSSFRIVNPSHPEAAAGGEKLDRSQVMFAHLPNPSDPLSALAPVSTQLAAIRIDDHIQTSQERFFENGIFPGVIVTMGKDPHPDVAGGVRPRLTGQQRRQVVGAIRKVMGGVANYGNPAIVDGLIESIERLSATSNEMGWEKSEDKVRTRILSAFGVHPYILGEPVGVGGYAQVAKIEERFCKRVNTFLDMLGTVLTNFVTNQEEAEPGLMVWWEKTEPHDPSLYWTNINAARTRDDISQNEVRALLGFAPDEDKNESVVGTAAATSIVQLLAQVGAGAISKEQAKALLVGMGLPDELAAKVAGVGEAKETLQQATGTLQEAVRALKSSPAFLAESIIESIKFNEHHDNRGQFAVSGIEAYHATAVEFAESIMKDGLKATGKGCPKGVYISTDPSEAFTYGCGKAQEQFQKGLSSGKYRPEDSKRVKVLLVVGDKAQFPEEVYKNTHVYRSKKDVPLQALKRIEVYSYADAQKFRMNYLTAWSQNKPLPKMPPPKPINTLFSSGKALGQELYLCFGLEEENEGEEEKSLKFNPAHDSHGRFATGTLQEAVRALKSSPAFLAESIIESIKFNPHHDQLGQFATGGSGGGAGSAMAPDTGGGSGGGSGTSVEPSPAKPSTATHAEGKAPLIGSEDREGFLKDVANPPGGKLKISPKVAKKFLEDGDAESFAEAMSAAGGQDGFVARLRIEHSYAEKFGGFDIVKSKVLTDVNNKSIAVAKGMTEKQRNAIQQYTTDDYYDVNKALRTGKKQTKSGQQMVDAVNKAVNDVGRWSKPETIYHGVASSSPEKRQAFLDRVQKHIKEGIPWEEKAILSTSASRKMSEAWIGKKNVAGGGVLMRIKARSGAAISTFTGLAGQQEILQKPGTKYKVLGVKTEKGHRGQSVTVVDFEEIS